MLSDDELEALLHIERRLRWESPELVQLFGSTAPPSAKDRRRPRWAQMLVATVAFAWLTLHGPRPETVAQFRARDDPPPLRRILPSRPQPPQCS
jgi:hypothetical protein